MKKVLAILLALAMVLSLAACGEKTPAENTSNGTETNTTENTTENTTSNETEENTTTETGKKVYHTYLSAEVDTLNGAATVSEGNDTPLSYCSAYLWRPYPNEDGMGYHWLGDVAKDLPKQMDEEGKVWQFTIDERAQWANGDPINADTYMFTFKTILDPLAVNAMASFLYDNQITIVNGEEYVMQGDSNTVAWEDVGIKKIDDYTIELTLVNSVEQSDVCTHFDIRTLTPLYQPLYESTMAADGVTSAYGSTLDNFMSCGPYILTRWDYDDMQVYEKNPNYWHADLYNFDEIQVRIVPEMNSRIELFESGLIDSLDPDASTLVTYIDDPRLVNYSSVMVYHFDVNCKNPTNPLSANLNYRKALYCAMDRKTMAEEMWYAEPAATYVSNQAGILAEGGQIYRETEEGKGVYDWIEETFGDRNGYNPELAKEYMQKAFEECGLDWEKDVVTLQAINSNGYPEESRMIEFFGQEFPKIFDNRILVEQNIIGEGMALEYIAQYLDKWDLSFMDWGRSLSRTLPYQAFYYFREAYEDHPNNYFPQQFQDAWDAADAVRTEDYATVCKATADLEKAALESMIVIPVIQGVNYTLFSEHLSLPVQTYIPGFGWGTMYADTDVIE